MNTYHINNKTGRVNICRAKPDNCPLGGGDSHFDSKSEALSFNESQLSKELKPLKSFKKVKEVKSELSIEEKLDSVYLAKTLGVVSDVKIKSLIKKILRRGYSLKETEALLEKYGDSTPFYVYYNGNQEITLNYEDYETRKTFLKGACAFIANEVSRVTGKPIVLFSSKYSTDSYWEGHAVVKLSEGLYFDVEGDKRISDFRYPDFASFEEKEVSQEEFEKIMKIKNGSIKNDLGDIERAALAKICFDLISDHKYLFTDKEQKTITA